MNSHKTQGHLLCQIKIAGLCYSLSFYTKQIIILSQSRTLLVLFSERLAVSMLVLEYVMVAAHGPAAKGQDVSERVSVDS